MRRLEDTLETPTTASRYASAPNFIGSILASRSMYRLMLELLGMKPTIRYSTADLLPGLLSLVDMKSDPSLLAILVNRGYTLVSSRRNIAALENRPGWFERAARSSIFSSMVT